ncbi:hypothetical protein B0H19DRAFT_1116673 [Mycena capillaripes]|nr:hypothetical protein B0H19DRAFT_1116673 [Mycena capillaripes]
MGLAPFQIVRAVSRFLKSTHYEPPSLPLILDCDWNTIFRNDATPATGTTPRVSKATRGKEILSFALFLMLDEEADGKPADFIATTRAYFLSPDVLQQIMNAIDPRLTKNAVTVETGFQVVVGHVWELLDKNTDKTVDWLRFFFIPLVKVAASTKVKAPSKPERKTTETRPLSNEKTDLVFLQNLRDLQIADYASSPSSTESSPCHFSPSAIPSFDLQTLSPLKPGVLTRSDPRTPPVRVLDFYQSSTDPGYWSSNLQSPSHIENELEELLFGSKICTSEASWADTTSTGSSTGPSSLKPAFEFKSSKSVNTNVTRGTGPVLVVLGPNSTILVDEEAEFEQLWKEVNGENIPEQVPIIKNAAGPRKALATPEQTIVKRGERSPLTSRNA